MPGDNSEIMELREWFFLPEMSKQSARARMLVGNIYKINSVNLQLGFFERGRGLIAGAADDYVDIYMYVCVRIAAGN